MEKQLIQNQIGLFLKENYNDSFENISLKLKEFFGKDAGSQIFSYPSGVPFEIPRLIFNIPDITINFAINRVDIFSSSYSKNLENINKIINIIIDDLDISIKRVGFVSNYFFDKDLDKLKTLFKEDKISNLEIKEIGYRVNIKESINGFDCNSIEYLQEGEINKDGIKKQGIIIQRDINISQDNNLLNSKSLISFIRDVNDKNYELLIYDK